MGRNVRNTRMSVLLTERCVYMSGAIRERKRYIIRNMNSTLASKPRVFDIVLEEGRAFFEVKQEKRRERVSFEDVIEQIKAAKEEVTGD